MKSQNDVVRVTGRFVFSTHRAFNDAVDRALQTDVPVVLIDLSDVSYIDSAALGMLLLARHRAEALGKKIGIRGASGNVLQVLEVANFSKLFDLS